MHFKALAILAVLAPWPSDGLHIDAIQPQHHGGRHIKMWPLAAYGRAKRAHHSAGSQWPDWGDVWATMGGCHNTVFKALNCPSGVLLFRCYIRNQMEVYVEGGNSVLKYFLVKEAWDPPHGCCPELSARGPPPERPRHVASDTEARQKEYETEMEEYNRPDPCTSTEKKLEREEIVGGWRHFSKAMGVWEPGASWTISDGECNGDIGKGNETGFKNDFNKHFNETFGVSWLHIFLEGSDFAPEDFATKVIEVLEDKDETLTGAECLLAKAADLETAKW